MDVWEVIFLELEKEKPLTVLFFIFHHYYGRSIKDLASIFKVKPETVSKNIGNLIFRIRKTYTKEGGVIGNDGSLIGGEHLCQ